MDTIKFRPFVAVSVCALFGALTVPAATWADHPDSWVTAKTKIALATSDNVSAVDVNVDTVEGRVTLHGMVPTEQAKTNANTIATAIEGVKEVRNLLQVVPDAKVDVVEAKDDVILDAVTSALANDEITKDSDIEVQSVNAGVVLLGGEADSLLQHLEAIRVASRTKGVRRVATEVQSDDALYDEKLWHDPTRDHPTTGSVKKDAKDAASKTGDAVKGAAGATKDAAVATGEAVRDGAIWAGKETGDAAGSASGAVKDAWITTAAKTRLIANSEVPAMAVNVDTDDGVVTLFGYVPSQAAKTVAETEVRKVSGVVDVRNRLEIESSPRGSASVD
jgi:hyperosmotically inducible protein